MLLGAGGRPGDPAGSAALRSYGFTQAGKTAGFLGVVQATRSGSISPLINLFTGCFMGK